MNESTLVPREEMNDLDWLARNVHVWPDGKRDVLVRRPRNVDELIWSSGLSNAGWITKHQWLARRAELQNKPNWETHEYKVIAQGRNGGWYGSNYSEEKFGHESSFCITGTGWNYICDGIDLGDWRDTLEKRPEKTIVDICGEVTQKNRHEEIFEPFVSVEDAKQDIGNLEWLAASIAEWPEIKDWNIKMDRGVSFFDDGVHIYNSDGSDYETISKRDWEIKVMELNKKPSIKTAKALAEAKLIEDKEPAGVYGVDHFYKPVCTEIAEDAATARRPEASPSSDIRSARKECEELRAEFHSDPSSHPKDHKITTMKIDGDVKHFGGIIDRSILVKEDSAKAKQPGITQSKYTKTIRGVSVDVYDVLQAWGVSNPALQHLIKKALQCGQRGHKDNAQDLQDIIDSAIRAKESES